MRGFLIFLGLLVMLAGAATAAAQYAPVDLSFLDSQPQVKSFLASPMALYAGGGAAGLGLLVMVLAAFAGRGGKKEKTSRAARPAAVAPAPPAPERPAPAPPPPLRAVQPAPQPVHTIRPSQKPQPAPVAAQPAPAPASEPHTPEPPKAKPQASGAPPAGVAVLDAARADPRLLNRRRVTDLVTIKDALEKYHKKHGAYPVAAGLAGLPDRGAQWVPGLAPEFIDELPRDPAASTDRDGPQYVYASDGKDYKLLAQNVPVGDSHVQVLGVRIDPTRNPTRECAAFGFWTPGFASA